jgi:hypothetical protein
MHLTTGALGLAALALFAGGAVLWRGAHRDGPHAVEAPAVLPAMTTAKTAARPADSGAQPTLPPTAIGPAATPRRVSQSLAEQPVQAVPRAAPLPAPDPDPVVEPRQESRPSIVGTERWYLDRFRTQAASDPEAFAGGAKGRLASAEAPLAEKVALLRTARETDPALADGLYAAALDFNGSSNPALREAAVNLLLRDLQKPRPDPATWERIRAFALGSVRPVDPLRARVAGALYAAAPEGQLVRLALEAEQDPDPAFLREAWSGLTRNPATRALDLAADLARRNVRLSMLQNTGVEATVE